jgi:hypothetical protein
MHLETENYTIIFGTEFKSSNREHSIVIDPVLIPIKKISLKLIMGQWLVNGKFAHIVLEHNVLMLNNEAGTSSQGILSKDLQFLLAPDWGNINATLSDDEKELKWSNGTSWIR